MAKLSVNVNKIALIRNSRDKNRPNLEAVSRDIIHFGAQGLTVHPRPDGRHVRRTDLPVLSQLVREENVGRSEADKLEFNVEGYPSADFLVWIRECNPDQATLVPDPPEALTSNAGWRVRENRDFLTHIIGELRGMGVRSSLFIDPFTVDEAESEALLQIKPDRIELYTEAYADAYGSLNQERVTQRYRDVALQFYDLGIGINAGHDLNQENLHFLLRSVPVIEEVSIGHAIVCEALYQGLETVIHNYLRLVRL